MITVDDSTRHKRVNSADSATSSSDKWDYDSFTIRTKVELSL